MRAGASDDDLADSALSALGRKAPRHHMEEAGASLVLLAMRGIGG
jgi:cyclic pyranopterin phosphate synthase